MAKVNQRILKAMVEAKPYFTPLNITVTGSVILLLAAVIFTVVMYNTLARFVQDVYTAESNLRGAVQMRTNLLPVFINTTDTFKKHEKKIFLDSAKIRTESAEKTDQATGEPSEAGGEHGQPAKKPWQEIPEQAQKAGALAPGADILSKLIATAESYPELKSSEPFLLLMNNLTDAELKIYEARTKYNEAVNIFEKEITTFPNRFFAWIFGYTSIPYYESQNEPEWKHPTAGMMDRNQ